MLRRLTSGLPMVAAGLARLLLHSGLTSPGCCKHIRHSSHKYWNSFCCRRPGHGGLIVASTLDLYMGGLDMTGCCWGSSLYILSSSGLGIVAYMSNDIATTNRAIEGAWKERKMSVCRHRMQASIVCKRSSHRRFTSSTSLLNPSWYRSGPSVTVVQTLLLLLPADPGPHKAMWHCMSCCQVLSAALGVWLPLQRHMECAAHRAGRNGC